MPRLRSSKRRRGAATVELLITMPIFFVLLVGIWEVGRLVEVQQLVNNAAREGGRQASSGKYTSAQVEQAVTTYLTNAGLPTTDGNGNSIVTVTAVDVTAGGGTFDPSTYTGNVLPQLDQVQVSVSYTLSDNVRYLTSTDGKFYTKWYGTLGCGTFVPNGTKLTCTVNWLVMSDVPINVPTSIPSAPLQ